MCSRPAHARTSPSLASHTPLTQKEGVACKTIEYNISQQLCLYLKAQLVASSSDISDVAMASNEPITIHRGLELSDASPISDTYHRITSSLSKHQSEEAEGDFNGQNRYTNSHRQKRVIYAILVLILWCFQCIKRVIIESSKLKIFNCYIAIILLRASPQTYLIASFSRE